MHSDRDRDRDRALHPFCRSQLALTSAAYALSVQHSSDSTGEHRIIAVTSVGFPINLFLGYFCWIVVRHRTLRTCALSNAYPDCCSSRLIMSLIACDLLETYHHHRHVCTMWLALRAGSILRHSIWGDGGCRAHRLPMCNVAKRLGCCCPQNSHALHVERCLPLRVPGSWMIFSNTESLSQNLMICCYF